MIQPDFIFYSTLHGWIYSHPFFRFLLIYIYKDLQFFCSLSYFLWGSITYLSLLEYCIPITSTVARGSSGFCSLDSFFRCSSKVRLSQGFKQKKISILRYWRESYFHLDGRLKVIWGLKIGSFIYVEQQKFTFQDSGSHSLSMNALSHMRHLLRLLIQLEL